ncbi:DUF134 domain-containing protein [Clostridium sp. 'deep sea']|uniref:DUF134 domain-containing protein n=1 Tax=Clostridium sp. 'deep sea' TaxID=2779445 RepID=UPI001896940A|nr:DUF134 domain-containing protein [Clostridium sp. 'deep sea']QOR36711.1 DUF134 domain-containing protein [Clostridium sp. 'deep sea']
MARPPKQRRIETIPQFIYFKPAGVAKSRLKEYTVSFEELESLRLKDIENLDNEQCAVKMNVSRTTFQRILASARNKVAMALINGGAIRIDGGNYRLADELLQCPHCTFKFKENVRCDKEDKDINCPKFIASQK